MTSETRKALGDAMATLRAAIEPKGLTASDPVVDDEDFVAVEFGGDVDRWRTKLHFAGAEVELGEDRHYHAKVDAFCVNAVKALQSIASKAVSW